MKLSHRSHLPTERESALLGHDIQKNDIIKLGQCIISNIMFMFVSIT